jgi:TatA/E family protein of Tat protein translocase
LGAIRSKNGSVMFGSLSFNEILFIMVLALLIFGPKRLPQIGRTMGKALGEFRRASSDLKRSMEVELTLAEERERATTGKTTPIAASGTQPRRDADAVASGSVADTDGTARGEDDPRDFGVPESAAELDSERSSERSEGSAEAPDGEPLPRPTEGS